MATQTVHLLDYVAGNIRSLVNAIEEVGFTVKWIKRPEDVEQAEVSHEGASYKTSQRLTAQTTSS